MKHWIAAAAELSTAIVLDALDEFGLRHQAILNTPPRTSRNAVIGRAKTMLWVDFAYDDPNTYALELQAIDTIAPHDLVVCATANSSRAGVWGELLTTGALNRGAAGILTDGAVRDVAQMDAMGFPVFARHLCPYDSMNRQKVVAFDVAIEIDGTRVAPGDIVIADRDGAAVVPQELEAKVLAAALAKVRAENKFRDAVKAGMSLTEAYAKFKVL